MANPRYISIKSNADLIFITKQGLATGNGDRIWFTFDVGPYLSGLAKTLSSAAAVVTAGTGTAPTVSNSGNAIISGTKALFRFDDGVAPLVNLDGTISNPGTAWNGGAAVNPGQGVITITFTFSDASTLVVPVYLTVKDAK